MKQYRKGEVVPWGGGFVLPISEHRAAELLAMPHTEYLLTPEWRAKRAAAIDDADGRCEKCGKVRRVLQVHHLTYENKPNELRGDVRALCGRCHLDCHPEVEHRRLNAFIRSPEYERLFGKHPDPDSVFGLDAAGRLSAERLDEIRAKASLATTVPFA